MCLFIYFRFWELSSQEARSKLLMSMFIRSEDNVTRERIKNLYAVKLFPIFRFVHYSKFLAGQGQNNVIQSRESIPVGLREDDRENILRCL